MPVPSGPDPVICQQAERFAAALMQADIFLPYAQASGLDVAALHHQFKCSYASVALRLAEVVRHLPLLVVLYDRGRQGNPDRWPSPTRLADLKVKVVKRTAGFAPSGSPLLCGASGGTPHKSRSLPSGSLAERAARSGQSEYAEGDVYHRAGGVGLRGPVRVRRGGRFGLGRQPRPLEGTPGQGDSRCRALGPPQRPGTAVERWRQPYPRFNPRAVTAPSRRGGPDVR